MILGNTLYSQVVIFDYDSITKDYSKFVFLYKKEVVGMYYFWIEEHNKNEHDDKLRLEPLQDTDRLLTKIVPEAIMSIQKVVDDTIFCSLKIKMEKFPTIAVVHDTTSSYYSIQNTDSDLIAVRGYFSEESVKCYGFGDVEAIPVFISNFNEYLLISKGTFAFWRFRCWWESHPANQGIGLESEKEQFYKFLSNNLNMKDIDTHKYKFGFPFFTYPNNEFYHKSRAKP